MDSAITRDELVSQIDALKLQLSTVQQVVDAHDAIDALQTDPSRLFNCRLAAKFGFHKVDEFLDQLTEQDLLEWKAVAMIDGWFGDVDEEPEPVAPQPTRRTDGMMTPDEALKHFQRVG
jgi:hypothetical protein